MCVLIKLLRSTFDGMLADAFILSLLPEERENRLLGIVCEMQYNIRLTSSYILIGEIHEKCS